MSFIKRYFLRLYAIELSKEDARRASAPYSLGPYGEAVLRTVLLVVIIMAGLGASALAVGLSTAGAVRAFLLAYRSQVSILFSLASVIAAYILVSRWVREFKNSPQSASAFATERDRCIRAVQFYCVMAFSLSAPVLTSVLVR